MDSIFCIPQLSGSGFNYTRLPHVSHCVLSSGPIGGTFALPQPIPDYLVTQLTAQLQAQFRLYGSGTSAVAHVPPPPGRNRSVIRTSSRARSIPPPEPAPFTGRLVGRRPPPPAFSPVSSFYFSLPDTYFGIPSGRAAHDYLASNRRVRIRAEQRVRHTSAEREAARAQRRRDRQLDDFMSAASVYTADEEAEIRIRHL